MSEKNEKTPSSGVAIRELLEGKGFKPSIEFSGCLEMVFDLKKLKKISYIPENAECKILMVKNGNGYLPKFLVTNVMHCKCVNSIDEAQQFLDSIF